MEGRGEALELIGPAWQGGAMERHGSARRSNGVAQHYSEREVLRKASAGQREDDQGEAMDTHRTAWHRDGSASVSEAKVLRGFDMRTIGTAWKSQAVA